MKQYKLVVSGGTFDLFHIGHEEFLSYQLKISDKIILGITSDKYLKNYPKKHDVEDFETRKKSVLDFLKKENALGKVEIVPIDTPTPKRLSDPKLDALIVTSETHSSAEFINITRKKLGLRELKIEIFDLIKSQDGKIISSTRIREGEINRRGEKLIDSSWEKSTLLLPTSLRSDLKNPFGQIIRENKYQYKVLDANQITTVGDIATKTLVEFKKTPKIAIVDLVVEREKKFSDITEIGYPASQSVEKVKNKAGTISPVLWRVIKKGLTSRSTTVIQIDGEEDLAVLPLILLLPMGWKLFYGQPKKGLVVLVVDEKLKENAHKYLKKFKQASK